MRTAVLDKGGLDMVIEELETLTQSRLITMARVANARVRSGVGRVEAACRCGVVMSDSEGVGGEDNELISMGVKMVWVNEQ